MAPRGGFPVSHSLADKKYPEPLENLDDAKSKNQFEGKDDYNANVKAKSHYPA